LSPKIRRETLGTLLHRGIESYVAKGPDSPYVAGRSLKWLKVKVPKYREEERGFYKP
jgi:ATP-dependent DNA ligase